MTGIFSNIVMSLSLLFAGPHTAIRANEVMLAAYFDDGNDKQLVVDLRKRHAAGEDLTIYETSVLQAASRTGSIYMCKGASSNATLIQIDGRDAVITTAHALIDPKTGLSTCNSFKQVSYYPNISFHDPRLGNPTNFEKRGVLTDGKPPLNLDAVLGSKQRVKTEKDFLIFFLSEVSEPLSLDQLPDGSIRGFTSFDSEAAESGKITMIGLDPKVLGGLATTYQLCDYHLTPSKSGIWHSCDTVKGTSSSALLLVSDEALLLAGLHQQGTEDIEPLTSDYMFWNKGSAIRNAISVIKQ
jgi:hypothetical protein